MKRKDWLMAALLGVITLFTIAMAALDAGAIEVGHVSSVDVHEGSSLRCRTGPGAEYSSGARFSSGAELLVLREENGWALVAWPKYPSHPLGWVCADYLN